MSSWLGRFATEPTRRDVWWVVIAAAVVRLAVVIWAARRFPPAADGRFYDVVARRIAAGDGYTWLWPDGAVTYAAHYPVGYPGMVGASYALFGAHPAVAMGLNAAIGTAAAAAVHRIASVSANRAGALVAGLLVALHPGLVFYTAALMSEGVTAGLLAIALFFVVRARKSARPILVLVCSGLVLGVAILVRPQVVLIAPVFGMLGYARMPGSWWRGALIVSTVALLLVAPWTVRNCARMGQCVFVSANGGWNLLIGAGDGATGSWVPLDGIEQASACATEFDEAKKDTCFARAGVGAVAENPVSWLSLVPKKLSATFDNAGGAASYLAMSNPRGLSETARRALSYADVGFQRLTLLLALGAIVFLPGRRPRARRAVAIAGAIFAFLPAAWVAYLAVAFASSLLGRDLLRHLAAAGAAWVIVATAATHAVFFGSGRYGMVCLPLLSALAGAVLTRHAEPSDTSAEESRDAAD